MFNGEKKYLIYFGCHHKVGTSWFSKILSHVAKTCSLTFQYSNQTGLHSGTDIFFDDHSRLSSGDLDACRGVHLIRDPRDIIVSGYHYHKWTEETWANEPKDHWEGRCYKQMINALNERDGLIFEMDNVGCDTIREISTWNYSLENTLEVRYENLLANAETVFSDIFRHYNFDERHVESLVKLTSQYSFSKMKRRDKSKHYRSGSAGDWKSHFDPEMKEYFKSKFPNLLEKLNYEETNDW